MLKIQIDLTKQRFWNETTSRQFVWSFINNELNIDFGEDNTKYKLSNNK